jgi:competence protein ComEC
VLFDTGKNIVMPVLTKKGINRLDTVIVTHFDSDHVGGIPYILAHIPVSHVIDNGYVMPQFMSYYETIKKQKINHIKAKPGLTLQLSKDITLTILYPISDQAKAFKKNDRSVVCKLSYKEIDILITGDLEKKGEALLIDYYGDKLEAEVLKLGHHGSKTSTTQELLSVVNPRFGIVSAGRENRYGHPAPSVLARVNRNNW